MGGEGIGVGASGEAAAAKDDGGDGPLDGRSHGLGDADEQGRISFVAGRGGMAWQGRGSGRRIGDDARRGSKRNGRPEGRPSHWDRERALRQSSLAGVGATGAGPVLSLRMPRRRATSW